MLTIVKEKKQQARTAAVSEAVAALGELLEARKLSRKMEKGIATPVEKRRFRRLDRSVNWTLAERRFEKAAGVLELNGKLKKG